MSFSSTPLGQGRRLDHQTFLNKPRPKAHSPPRRTIPASYAYGGPTLGTRSPPKSQNAPALADPPDDTEEPALVRFARLKQREQASTNAPSGPQPNTSPHPEKWSVKDTSVNIASAFHTAANTDDSMNPNDSWTSGARRQVPRSTSVEYEKETQSTVNRRLAPPPSRTGARKPLSKAASIRHVPDSEGEQTEPSQSQERSRGKSPFEHILDAAQRYAPVSILMRARSREPEADQSHSRSIGNGAANESSSYDYSAEERDYQAQLATEKTVPIGPPRRNTVAHKRNRMSTDNKAYKPTQSDLEVSDEDFDDENGKRTRRKKKKGGMGGPPLTSLPIAAYDKRKKKKRANGKTNGDEDEESSEEQEAVAEQRSVRGQTPVIRAPSAPRGSNPPLSRSSIPPTSHPDDLIRSDQSDPENTLPPIREIDEDLLVDDFETPRQSTFSIGASLGHGVHGTFSLGWMIIRWFFGLLGFIARFVGKVLGLTLDITVHKPFRWLTHADYTPFLKAAFVGITIYGAWYTLRSGSLDLSKLMPSRSPYHPPDAPVTNLGEFADRLMRLEGALNKLTQDSEKSKSWIEGSRSELVGLVGALESQVHKESVRFHDSETKFRASTSDAIQVVKQEVDSLQAQLRAHQESAARSTPVPNNDEEARAKLRTLEERLGSAESGVKEALELGKNVAKVGASTGTAAAWWSKLASGNAGSALTIKSSDGQDVTALINQLVGSSVYRLAKDVVARPDYALYSAGAQVIPALTTQTYEIPPGGLISQVAGFFTGGGNGAIGRPPVTALHHESNPGHCWPFPGTQGQLGIKLAGPTFISDVTIDHVAKELAPDRRSAPRYMELWGLVEGKDNLGKLREWREARASRQEEARMEAALSGEPLVEDAEPPVPPLLRNWGESVRVANFSYNIYAPDHIQTFAVPQEVKELGIDFGVVALVIENNWGRDDFTCLYRVRVHGQPLLEAPAPLSEEYAGPPA
ncbi:uncharacterized protein B0H18DRAFT_938156 [Fomitopsis serialis]|uniref:uncharacterized protein n=1 Tax=Fomitopsis serialis TaxID=139415 RepID=UPI0020082102|nr:uncharacterized protein B0H18DRAFT_938156 [Neoantrodia serialis]KAH9917807.1 hypothetical protein B0H18DRAFT_938156 [Neoantrodia serialis]